MNGIFKHLHTATDGTDDHFVEEDIFRKDMNIKEIRSPMISGILSVLKE